MKILLSLLSFFFLVASFSSKQYVAEQHLKINDPGQMEKWLTRPGGWKIVAQGIDPPIQIREETISDFTSLMDPCDFEAAVKFIPDPHNPDADMVEHYGPKSCDPAEPPYVIAHLVFKLADDPPGFLATDTDEGSTSFWRILHLDEKRLVIQAINGEKTLTDEFSAHP